MLSNFLKALGARMSIKVCYLFSHFFHPLRYISTKTWWYKWKARWTVPSKYQDNRREVPWSMGPSVMSVFCWTLAVCVVFSISPAKSQTSII